MSRNLIVCVVAAALAVPAVVHAQPRPVWDSRGWMMLGERTVNGRVDHDRVEVGRYEGRFSKLTLVVENADVEMLDVRIEFADHTDFHPPVTGFYREGSRTRVIDLPGGDRVIRFIDFRYRNVPGEWNAKVGVWALRDGPAAPAPVWDANGWTMLGQREVHGHGRENADRIEVGRYEGRFSKLTVVVLDSDLEMIDMNVLFGRGDAFHPAVSQFFREGTRTRVLDLPGDDRIIRFIDFRYRNVPGEGHARVQVWGKADVAPPPPPPPPAFTWDQRGWQMLGEREVHGHGREDIDRIQVGRYEGRFSRLTVVVMDSDLEMIDFSIKFHHGEPFHPGISQFFREGTRTRVIEMPGDEQRTIEWIEFKYRNLPGEGHARVQVWAK